MSIVRKFRLRDRDFRKIRPFAIVASLLIHSVVLVGLFVVQHSQPASDVKAEISLYGSGGGGGEGAEDQQIQFGPQAPQHSTRVSLSGKEVEYSDRLTLVQIHVLDDLHAIPVPIKNEPETPKPFAKKKVKQKPIIAENLPTRWIRRGTGPGSGGGAGGGSGGGIGKGQGYSIDWGGKGGRRLLSGLLPRYPEGTDKQMAVTLQFSVLPDGSVEQILPTRKTDEVLESAAINALRTWRFDPLPSEIEQKSQVGRVTFNFKLE